MRPTTSTMLQQNNNNNYPCLNMSGSTREMLQKCSRASLPFPSRLELGLGDLPLIRGLRAWALCSKNRRKPGGLLGAGQAPVAPPSGRVGSASCPRPADVYLSEEWGRMGYGLPLGLDAGQPGIGALVTVATLKTSEGSGKTQTQCLFLRTEKGSCLYSTAKPGSGVTSSAASSVVGGWLRGKTGGGGGGGGGGSRDTPTGRRDNGPTPPTQTGANRVRVRSGRRWRKSCNVAGREKTGASRERQRSSREDPAGDIALEERQEERDKGGLDIKQLPSQLQENRRGRQEKEGACRSPRCCHSTSPKTCTQCGRRAQRREGQDEHKGGESPKRGNGNKLNSEAKGMRKERQRSEEEEKGGICRSESSDSVLVVPNPDLESNHFHPESHICCDAEEMKETESSEELKRQTSNRKDNYSEREQDTNSEVMKIHTGINHFIDSQSGWMNEDFPSTHNRDSFGGKPSENPCEEIADGVNGLEESEQEAKKKMERVDADEEEGSSNQTPAEFWVVSSCCEGDAFSTCLPLNSTAASPEPSSPVEGSTCNADRETCGVRREDESSKEYHHEGHQHGVADPGIMGKEELDVSRFEQGELDFVAEENIIVKEDRNSLFSRTHVENSSQLEERVFEKDGMIATENNVELNGAECRDELVWESQEESREERVNPEEKNDNREIWRRECTPNEVDSDEEHHAEDDMNGRIIQEDDTKDVTRNCAPKENWRIEETAGGCRRRNKEDGDTCGQTSITYTEANGETSTNIINAPRADPSTSLALSLANPAPSLAPLGSMATSLPCLEAEEEEEDKEVVGVTAGEGEGSRERKRRLGRDLEEQSEEERGSIVATEEERKEEEEVVEEEEDEFGVFMQAEGEPAWSEESTMFASVPSGSRESAETTLGNHAISGESTHWTGWTDSSFHQSDGSWTAFPQDCCAAGRGAAAGQWWPTNAVEESRDGPPAPLSLAAVFAEAFPTLPASSSRDRCDLDAVPTLTQLLRVSTSQDQDQDQDQEKGLLDSFHDLNKMICQRYKRANGVSRDLLLKTLRLEQPHTENRPAPRTANRRLSPGLPSANQHAQSAAAKRRLSYDYNRNVME